MIRNSAKSSWTIEELGWDLYDKGKLTEWDGLIYCFLDLVNKNPDYEKDIYVLEWKRALIKAINEINKEKSNE